MHYGIAVLTYANSAKEAIQGAETGFEYLCEGQDPFDGFEILPPALKADSKKGKALIEQFFGYYVRDFKEHYERLKECLTLFNSEDELEKEQMGVVGPLDMRYYAYNVGRYKGIPIRLYTDDAEGIRTREDLKNVLNRYACLAKTDPYQYPIKRPVWIVKADVHC